MDLEDLAEFANPAVQGWINYYGRFCPSAMHSLMMHLNRRLVKWAMRKYKRFRFHGATHWLGRIAHRGPGMFVHWRCGYKPTTDESIRKINNILKSLKIQNSIFFMQHTGIIDQICYCQIIFRIDS